MLEQMGEHVGPAIEHARALLQFNSTDDPSRQFANPFWTRLKGRGHDLTMVNRLRSCSNEAESDLGTGRSPFSWRPDTVCDHQYVAHR